MTYSVSAVAGKVGSNCRTSRFHRSWLSEKVRHFRIVHQLGDWLGCCWVVEIDLMNQMHFQTDLLMVLQVQVQEELLLSYFELVAVGLHA